MRRRLLNLLAALSLLMCAAVVVLWVRSYVRVDVVLSPKTPVGSHVFASEDGSLVLLRYFRHR